MTDNGEKFIVKNPATGEKAAEYPQMDSAMVDELVGKAREMAPLWAMSSFEDRKRILLKAASILADNAEHYASVVSAENGKTRFDAIVADIYPACDIMHYYGLNAERFLSSVRVQGNILLPGRKCYYVFEPKGVIGVIAPWNYPFSLCVGPVVSAIAAGNAVVLKPSSQTSGSGLALKEILVKAGLPEDVLQVATGSGSVTGKALVEHPGLDMLFFTGSTEVGKGVNIEAARRLIPTVMELGGKDVAIVTKNANVSRAVHSILWGSFTNSGQTCIGIEIALVERPVYQRFITEAIMLAKTLRHGDKAGEIGSMTMRSQLEKVEDQVADAVEKGAKILTGGKRGEDERGMYYKPTLMTDVTLDMKVMKDETFGPLLPIVPFDTIDEAISIANSTEYGLSGAVFTEDAIEGREISARMKTGAVNINDTLVTFAVPSLPFGGMKHSGVGRYHSEMGIRAFTDVKSITEFKWGWKKEFYHYPMTPGVESALPDTLRMVYSRNIIKRLWAAIKVAPFLFRALREVGAFRRKPKSDKASK